MLYVGGIDGTFAGQDSVYASADDGVTWSEIGSGSFPASVRQCRAMYFDDKLLVVGGDGTSDKVYSTTDGLNWIDEGTLPQTFREFDMVEYQGKLWVIG